MSIFLRLRNRGFKKYVLSKLFQHVTYSQRDKLLNTELPLPNVCEPLTIQEAERRILLDGEAAYSLSQGDEGTTSHLVSNPQSSTFLLNNNSNSNNTIAQGNARIIGRHQGITSTEGRVSFRQAIRLFHIKNMALKCKTYSLQYEFIFLFRNPKAEAKSVFGPSGIYAEG